MNVFISGGAGLIGNHLLDLLHEDENVSRVMIFDNLAPATVPIRWEHSRPSIT